MPKLSKPSGPYPADTAIIRILVVDDSAYMRYTISKMLNETPGMMVAGMARDGQEALELIPRIDPDVITLDVEMPRLDGLSTLREIMAHHPRPVVMLSSLTTEGARETIQALTWGAVDFVAKPSTKANIAAVIEELIAKVRQASEAQVWVIPKEQRFSPTTSSPDHKAVRSLGRHDKVVIIGASTGGPRALNAVFSSLLSDLEAALLIVQHMPVGFTRSLAERLNNISSILVKEAEPEESLEVGKALIAPGGFHMTLDKEGLIQLNQNPTIHGVRPAVDVTMSAAVQHFSGRIVGVVLTGMGHDGTNGAALIKSSGGWVIAEDESTCVVWGMPRSVIEAGAADEIVPLNAIPSAIYRAVKEYEVKTDKRERVEDWHGI